MDETRKSPFEAGRRADAGRRGVIPEAVRRGARFRDDESGAMMIFGLMCLVAMLLFSGISVDVIRYETMRTQLQNTLDNATLAAANLNQTDDPTTVVQDYMNKAGLGQYLGAVTVTSGLNARTVTASAKADIAPAFMTLAGVTKMTAPAYSTASESIGNVEISLVLDVSGSMNSYNKIGNLRDAAKDFVTTMFGAVDPGKLSISIVPYAAQVTAGPNLYKYFKTTNDHNYSYCLDFAQSDFATTEMPQTQLYQQAGNFDPWYNYLGDTTIDRYGQRVCPKESSRYILPFSGNETDLKTMIGNLKAGGNTSIDVGMKWGAALLDPSLQPVVTDMIDKGELPAGFAGRPYNYADKDAMKVIVVMTDGENTSRPILQAPYNSGPSLVYSNSDDNQHFSLYDATSKQYYWTADSNWHSQPYGDGVKYQKCSYYYGCTTETAPGTSVQMSWPDVWNDMTVNWFLNNIVSRAYGSWTAQQWKGKIYNWHTAHDSTIPGSQDAQLLDVCDAAKNNYVTIYSIGFMASSGGTTVLKKCATKPGYFYDVQNLDIATAFASIANSINKLRLTQ